MLDNLDSNLDYIEAANQVLIWVHGDCLNPHGPAFRAFPGASAVFVFDNELLEKYKISLKRIMFMYECVLEIPNITIRKGEVAAELAATAQTLNLTKIVTVDSIAPRFRQIVNQLRREFKLPVEILDPDPFVSSLDPDESFDLKRFSRYWQAISKEALRLP